MSWQGDLFALIDRLEAGPSRDGVANDESARVGESGRRLAQLFAVHDRRPPRPSPGRLPELARNVKPADILTVEGGDDLESLLRGRRLCVLEPLAEVADPDRVVQLVGLGGLLLRRLQVGQQLLAGRFGFLL